MLISLLPLSLQSFAAQTLERYLSALSSQRSLEGGITKPLLRLESPHCWDSLDSMLLETQRDWLRRKPSAIDCGENLRLNTFLKIVGVSLILTMTAIKV